MAQDLVRIYNLYTFPFLASSSSDTCVVCIRLSSYGCSQGQPHGQLSSCDLFRLGLSFALHRSHSKTTISPNSRAPHNILGIAMDPSQYSQTINPADLNNKDIHSMYYSTILFTSEVKSPSHTQPPTLGQWVKSETANGSFTHPRQDLKHHLMLETALPAQSLPGSSSGATGPRGIKRARSSEHDVAEAGATPGKTTRLPAYRAFTTR